MVAVRPLQTSDIPQTIVIIVRALRESFQPIYPPALIEDFCTKYTPEKFAERMKTIDYFVAEDTGTEKILGVIGLKEDHPRTFFVDPSAQGKGIGRKLYDYLETQAKRRGIMRLFLEGSPLGEPIYTHFGFKKIKTLNKERLGTPYTDAYMEKDLV